jgi:hypothetical protein
VASSLANSGPQLGYGARLFSTNTISLSPFHQHYDTRYTYPKKELGSSPQLEWDDDDPVNEYVFPPRYHVHVCLYQLRTLKSPFESSNERLYMQAGAVDGFGALIFGSMSNN